MFKSLLISLACLVFVLNASGQQEASNQSADEIEKEITSLLLNKDISEVIKQLENEKPSTVAPLLRRLIIYSRAGHTSRVRDTLKQLADA